MEEIIVPNFTPRKYQLPFLKAMDEGTNRAVLVWHRRAGKEIACFNFMIKQAWWHRKGTYVYFFPTSTLGRRILWDGSDKNGRRFLDYIPKEIIDGSPNSNEMKVRLKNGSVIQVVGSDQIINVGINPVGCVFSEYSLQDPKTWAFTRPILRENGGWAVFNFTPRGRNHAYDLFLMAKNNPEWFCQRLSIADTKVLSEEDMEAERVEGMSEHLIQQEYYCSFDLGVEGAYYAKLLNKAEIEKRVCRVPLETNASVDTYWDLGVSDETAILFCQNVGQEIHIIDIYRNQGEGLAHYAKVLQDKANEGNWIYGDHYAPHDIRVRELGSGAQTRLQMAKDLGIPFKIVPNIPIAEGIELARGIFPRLWIDENKCKFLLKALENYHKDYNERLAVYSSKPTHDWSSHICFVGETEVLTRSGTCPIMFIRENDEILTLEGWKKCTSAKMTKKNVKVVEVSFSDNTKVKCTPEHLFLTETGWKSAEKLERGTRIQSSLTKLPNILKESFIENGPKKTITRRGGLGFIGWFGCQRLERYLKNATFIIKTEIQIIIRYITSNVFRHQNTCGEAGMSLKMEESLDFLNMREKKLRSGMHLKKGVCGTEETPFEPKVGQSGKGKKGSASFVKRILSALLEKTDTSKNIVTQTARPLIIEKIRSCNKNQDVWCIGVPDVGHFSLKNGAVVHNCDAFRYMSIMQNKKRNKAMTEEDANKYEQAYSRKY